MSIEKMDMIVNMANKNEVDVSEPVLHGTIHAESTINEILTAFGKDVPVNGSSAVAEAIETYKLPTSEEMAAMPTDEFLTFVQEVETVKSTADLILQNRDKGNLLDIAA